MTGRACTGRWIGTASLVVVVAMALLGPMSAAAEGMDVRYARFSHVAFFSDGSDPVTLRVRVSGPVAQVQASDLGYGVLRAGDEVGMLTLFDDGSHGDLRPGDQVFSRADITALVAGSQEVGGMEVTLTSTEGESRTVFANDAEFVALDPALAVPVQRIDASTQATWRVANLKVSPRVFPVADTSEGMYPPDLVAVARRFYQRYPDHYDFLQVFTSIDVPPNYFHLSLRNRVRGIGYPVFDNGRHWGSARRLLGVNFLGKMGAGAMTHETLHQWGIGLDRFGLSSAGHWRTVDIRGYLFGSDFVPVGEGRFRITWTPYVGNWRMPAFEMYLAGFASAGKVPRVTLLRGVDPLSLEVGDIVRPTSVVRVTIGAITRSLGPRRPSSRTAQRDFRSAAILVTPGRLASAAEMALHEAQMVHFSSTSSEGLPELGIGRPSWAWSARGTSRMLTELGPPRR